MTLSTLQLFALIAVKILIKLAGYAVALYLWVQFYLFLFNRFVHAIPALVIIAFILYCCFCLWNVSLMLRSLCTCAYNPVSLISLWLCPQYFSTVLRFLIILCLARSSSSFLLQFVLWPRSYTLQTSFVHIVFVPRPLKQLIISLS